MARTSTKTAPAAKKAPAAKSTQPRTTKAPPRASKAKKEEKPEVEPVDAITLLKADHRTVDALFQEYEQAERADAKARIVARICRELKIHTMIEEEIFYPAVRPEIDGSLVDESVVEHDGAKLLINNLEGAKASEPYYDAKVKVLAEEIRHHVHEEEKWLRGMFAQARRSKLDMMELGTKLATRKAELEALADGKGLPAAKPIAVTAGA